MGSIMKVISALPSAVTPSYPSISYTFNSGSASHGPLFADVSSGMTKVPPLSSPGIAPASPDPGLPLPVPASPSPEPVPQLSAQLVLCSLHVFLHRTLHPSRDRKSTRLNSSH